MLSQNKVIGDTLKNIFQFEHTNQLKTLIAITMHLLVFNLPNWHTKKDGWLQNVLLIGGLRKAPVASWV